MFHPFTFKSLPRKLNDPFNGKPHRAAIQAMDDLSEWIKTIPNLKTELCRGKMIGVLVVKSKDGETGYLAAFSGQVMSSNIIEGFVPPVFDILSKGSYFLEGEKTITELNRKIRDLESDHRYARMKDQLRLLKIENERKIQEYKDLLKQQKAERDKLRKSAELSEEEIERLNNESARGKSELKKMQKSASEEEQKYIDALSEINSAIIELKRLRIEKSELLQQRIFRDFKFKNGLGQEKDLLDIFNGQTPPSGAGECCAPRLLNYAFLNQMTPLAIAEFWIGASPEGKVRHNGTYYHACRSKCLPILSFMLQGIPVSETKKENTAEEESIKTIYRDDDIVVISKPSGMLSVKGKEDIQSVEEWAEKRFPMAEGPIIVHRLDQDTSGLMVLALTKEAHKSLQKQFENHTIEKKYIAVLKGNLKNNSGEISLPLMADISNRPMQYIDPEGLPAVTQYRVIKKTRYRTRVEFTPLTGRTHQLRVHSSSKQGLNCPIIGDRLYSDKKDKSRLLLHAEFLSFVHPTSGKKVSYTDAAPF